MDEYEKLKELSIKISQSFDSNAETISRMLGAVNQMYMRCSEVAPGTAKMVNELVEVIDRAVAQARPSIDFSALYANGISALNPKTSDYEIPEVPCSPIVSEPVIQRSILAAERAAPYVESNLPDEHESIIPSIKEKKANFWTLDRIIALLSLLVTLFFGIVQMLQNEEREDPEQEKYTFIETSSEHIDDPDQEGVDLLQNLGDSIISILEELDLVKDQPDVFYGSGESAVDLSDSVHEPEDGNM